MMSQLTEYNEHFKNILNSLNPSQKKAVESIEGPVMVIAGPGTGKTQVLAARIANILLETDTNPENILCLTFTDSAATNMRQRLQKFIGLAAFKVNIYTFHALCNDIIQQNLALFPKNNLEPLSELENLDIMKILIDNFDINHPLKRIKDEHYFYQNALKQLFSNIKKEGFDINYLIEHIDNYIQKLPENSDFQYKRAFKTFKKGDLKQEQYNQECERLEKLKAAILELPKYNALLLQNNRYDFDDMINWINNLFEHQPHIKNYYQEKFQYILVDEYQDTSLNQNKLVSYLSDFWDKPNLFVVGDDDQSIYRFQGANIQNLLEFKDKYITDLDTELVVLTDNYRSTPNIVNIAKQCIAFNTHRLSAEIPNINKNFKSAHPNLKNLDLPIQYQLYQTSLDEFIDIAQKIKSLIINQNVMAQDIAVLFKENKIGDEFQRILQLYQIPFSSSRTLNVLDELKVKQFIQILWYCLYENQLESINTNDGLLFEILHFQFFNIPHHIITQEFLLFREDQKDYFKISFRQYLIEKYSIENSKVSSENYILNVIRKLTQYIELQNNFNFLQFMDFVFKDSGLAGFLMRDSDNLTTLNIFHSLFDFVKQEVHKNPSLSLLNFLEITKKMTDAGLSLMYQAINPNPNAVQLLTTHKSKGLEFKYVFIIQLSKHYWEGKRSPNSLFKLPQTIFEQVRKTSKDLEKNEDFEESRRLFYVALTRASEYLHISNAHATLQGKVIEASQFVAEIFPNYQEVQPFSCPMDTSKEYLLKLFDPLQSIQMNTEQVSLLKELVDNFKLNVTAFNNYLECPIKFYYQNLIKIPGTRSSTLYFGNVIHKTFERYFKESHKNNQLLSLEDLLVIFKKCLFYEFREGFNAMEINKFEKYGQECLKNYYQKYVQDWHLDFEIEKQIKVCTADGIHLNGRFDKIEFLNSELHIIDYKTGNPKKAEAKLLPPNHKDPHGGSYWRQAAFYYLLLLEERKHSMTHLQFIFDFIEPETPFNKDALIKKSIIISSAEIEEFKKIVVDVWQKIKQHDFKTGCGKTECYWCEFVKTNELNQAIVNENVEE